MMFGFGVRSSGQCQCQCQFSAGRAPEFSCILPSSGFAIFASRKGTQRHAKEKISDLSGTLVRHAICPLAFSLLPLAFAYPCVPLRETPPGAPVLVCLSRASPFLHRAKVRKGTLREKIQVCLSRWFVTAINPLALSLFFSPLRDCLARNDSQWFR